MHRDDVGHEVDRARAGRPAAPTAGHAGPAQRQVGVGRPQPSRRVPAADARARQRRPRCAATPRRPASASQQPGATERATEQAAPGGARRRARLPQWAACRHAVNADRGRPAVGSAPCPRSRRSRVQVIAQTAVHPAGRRPVGDRRGRRAGARRVRRPGLLPVLGQAEPGHRHQPRATCGTSSRSGTSSVLEHGTVTMYLTGVSRSLTARAASGTGTSPTASSPSGYVPERDAAVVEPAAIAEDPELHELFLPRPRPRSPPTPSCSRGWRSASPTSRTPRCAASRPGRRPARCCPTPPRPGRGHRQLPRLAALRRACGPASTPTSRSASWPWRACASCSGWPPTCSPTSGSARWPTAREVAASPLVAEG